MRDKIKDNTATFYSGLDNRALAEKFANINGKVTLETTRLKRRGIQHILM